MIVKAVINEWYQDYKKPSLYIAFPYCSFKCEKDCGKRVCQNSALANIKNYEVDIHEICRKYLSNPITKAIVCAGLEPLDSFKELYTLITILRNVYQCDDDVVIYTGYTEEECVQNQWITILKDFNNIIIKFGRYIPNQTHHYDTVLNTELASMNQYAKRIS